MAATTAGDIMIPLDQYPHIPYWFTLRQAIAEMEKSTLEIEGRQSLPRALLVFDEKYSLLGIVRRRDILSGLEPSFMHATPVPQRRKLFDVDIDPNLIDLLSDFGVQAIREHAKRPVSEVMSPIEGTAKVGDHMGKIIYTMLQKDLNLLPVLKEGSVVGVVRSVDVFREIAKLVL